MRRRLLNGFKALLTPTGVVERIAAAVGVGGAVFATVVTAAAALAPVPRAEALAAILSDADVCPDGWAGRQAAMHGVDEAWMTARYVETLLLTDDDAVLRRIARHLAERPDALPDVATRIALCVAASRSLVGPTAPAGIRMAPGPA